MATNLLLNRMFMLLRWMKLILPLLFSLTIFVARSQSLIAPVVEEDISMLINNSASVLLEDSTTVSGKLVNTTLGSGFLKNITVQLADGKKKKIKSDDILQLKIRSTSAARISKAEKGNKTYVKINKKDFATSIERDYIYFERVNKALKKNKPALVQLLNPGFDDNLKVYSYPQSEALAGFSIEDIKISSSQEEAYLFVKDTISILVKKETYKTQFKELYKDCPSMLASFRNTKKIRYSDIASHVFLYNKLTSKTIKKEVSN